jgi:hypothetical protein
VVFVMTKLSFITSHGARMLERADCRHVVTARTVASIRQ